MKTDTLAKYAGEGWVVIDREGRTWSPNPETRRAIASSREPHLVAVRICANHPERGEWTP